MSSDDSTPSADDLDPAVAGLLFQLHAAFCEEPGAPWSLARLSKRSELAMSTLRRALSSLNEAGLVEVREDEDNGRAMAMLTGEGVEFCAAIFPLGPRC